MKCKMVNDSFTILHFIGKVLIYIVYSALHTVHMEYSVRNVVSTYGGGKSFYGQCLWVVQTSCAPGLPCLSNGVAVIHINHTKIMSCRRFD